jgi:KDO2-lipid IV(A) lauroyltransferase
MKGLREFLYRAAVAAGLFFVVPLAQRLPRSLSKVLLRLKACTRFSLGTYRAYLDRPRLKEHALGNLRETLGIGAAEADRILLQLMELEVYVERNGFLLDHYTEDELQRSFSVQGLEHLDRALHAGRGVIFATVHSGDTLLFMLHLALKGYPIYGLFDAAIPDARTRDPLKRFAQMKDRKIGATIGRIYAGGRLTELFGVLRGNGIIVWMVDLPALNAKRRAVIDFLGKKVCVGSSFWEVAVKSGAALVPHINLYDHRTDRHIVHIGSPLTPKGRGIQDLFRYYEPFIREHPESWIGWYYFDMLASEEALDV